MKFASAFLAVLLPLAAQAAPIETYRVKTGSVEVKGESVRTMTSEAHYAEPPAEVWKLLNLFTKFPNFIPRVKSCESLGEAHGSEQIFLELDLPMGLPNIWNIVALKRDESNRRMDWEMLRGNLKVNRGFLKVREEGTGSVLSLEMTVDPGKLIPQFIVAWSTKNFVPKVLKSIGDQLKDPSAQPKPTQD